MEQRIHDCHDDASGAEASRMLTPTRGIGGAAHVFSSSPLELFLLSQEVLPAESAVPAARPAEWFEAATLDAEAKDKDASRKEERGGDDEGDADCGNFVADHLLSLIRGSVGGSAALGCMWRAPGQGRSADDDADDDDDESGEEGCDDEGDGTYDFGPPAPQPLAALDPRSAAWHAAAARERGKRRARHEVAARAAARATAEEQRKRAARRAAEAARRKALLGAHQVVDEIAKRLRVHVFGGCQDS